MGEKDRVNRARPLAKGGWNTLRDDFPVDNVARGLDKIAMQKSHVSCNF